MATERRSPLQNRVTPFGEIVAVPDRGMFIGNRGIIHDPAARTLLSRRWTTRRWLICDCGFKARRRSLMGEGSWTELFFLDEATAFAAGHRPCFECRHEDAATFRAAWPAESTTPPKVEQIDRTLHAQRLAGRVKRTYPIERPWSSLPDGAMIADGDRAFLIHGGAASRWTSAGYVDGRPKGEPVLLTPPATIAALENGYRPILHPSAKLA